MKMGEKKRRITNDIEREKTPKKERKDRNKQRLRNDCVEMLKQRITATHNRD